MISASLTGNENKKISSREPIFPSFTRRPNLVTGIHTFSSRSRPPRPPRPRPRPRPPPRPKPPRPPLPPSAGGAPAAGGAASDMMYLLLLLLYNRDSVVNGQVCDDGQKRRFLRSSSQVSGNDDVMIRSRKNTCKTGSLVFVVCLL